MKISTNYGISTNYNTNFRAVNFRFGESPLQIFSEFPKEATDLYKKLIKNVPNQNDLVIFSRKDNKLSIENMNSNKNTVIEKKNSTQFFNDLLNLPKDFWNINNQKYSA